MKVQELFEVVNSKVFREGFEKTKGILDGKYNLVATNGYLPYTTPQTHVSSQFRIEVRTAKNVQVGWVNFEEVDGKLEALDLVVQPKHRQQGIATEMYKFARELGNDIRPSSKQTKSGKLFWSKKDHSK